MPVAEFPVPSRSAASTGSAERLDYGSDRAIKEMIHLLRKAGIGVRCQMAVDVPPETPTLNLVIHAKLFTKREISYRL